MRYKTKYKLRFNTIDAISNYFTDNQPVLKNRRTVNIKNGLSFILWLPCSIRCK